MKGSFFLLKLWISDKNNVIILSIYPTVLS